MRRMFILVLVAALSLAVFGCTSTQKGGVIGSGTGALIGGLIGKASGNTTAGVLAGGVMGGAAGAYIGHYMDEQAEELEADLEGAEVERVGEGIQVTFDSGILFEVNQSELQPEAKANIEKLAAVLKKYDDTNILVQGHTDSDGSETYNQTLSEKRAEAVALYLISQNVTRSRMTVEGLGESKPATLNDSPEGKAQNRRVEVGIMANEELKKTAEEKAAQG